jgi:hypothetical protein
LGISTVTSKVKPLIGFRPRSTLGSVTRPPYDWD